MVRIGFSTDMAYCEEVTLRTNLGYVWPARRQIQTLLSEPLVMIDRSHTFSV
jgi:hypothetical protein